MFTKRLLKFTATAVLPVTAVLVSLQSEPAFAQFPVCSSASVDPDGDGFGWENNQTCLVNSGSANNSSSASNSSVSGFPVCRLASSDPDGDGYGFENNGSCIVTGDTGSQPGSPPVSAATSGITSSRFPACASSASDPDGDGFGFENGRSCQVTASNSAAPAATSFNPAPAPVPGVAPPPVAAATAGFSNGHPVCLTDASEVNNNGFGYENNRTCVVTGATATRNQPLLNQRSCINWLEIGYGNYRLQNNVWNFSAVFNDNWSQCIELGGSPGNYVAKWDYNWLPRNQGQEFAVKSYPQVYYGRKTRYNISGSVAETGLPQSINNLSRYRVQYDYSETGIVERNVALESFFHTSCEAEENNKQFEMMVWVGVPNIRTPGTQVTTATVDGQGWDVFVNTDLPWGYVAFVAQNPSNRGTLDWNAFVDWSRNVGPAFGVPAVGRNTCMGAIEMGTETFWGTGTFTLNRFQVTRG